MAIAIDATSSGINTLSQTSLTVAHTCTGTNLCLIVAVNVSVNTITGVTYNGVAMTQVGTVNQSGGNENNYLFGLLNPATGTHNIIATYSGMSTGGLAGASYAGVKQSGFPDSSVIATNTLGTSRTVTTTVVASNSWLVGMFDSDNSPVVAGTNALARVRINTDAGTNTFGILDSNGTNASGSASMQATYASNSNNVAIMVSIAPVASAVNSNFFEFM